ncbi:MAG TPA: HD domain-containing protein [Candidatus Gastranaerophilaceae bacterium]|nr:HD domain-containing protein [Candidatus Gastranaerophilaceae bacterium]HPT42143.1 HD domain-containing protein [Candidatus Gastranaerophilaceae bacterium]
MFDNETIYEVVIFSIGDTKSGTKMGKLQLKNTQNETLLNCILWEETLNRIDSKLFRTGNLVKIVSATYNEKFNNCLVSALELVKEAKLGIDESERNSLYSEILEYVNKISDEKLKNFIIDYFKEHEKEIKIAPAAKLMHHNYMGGLLVHIVECLKFADANMELFKIKIDKNKIYAACILHDIGKIFEYKIDTETGIIDYDENFRHDWVTHSQYGFSICMAQGFKDVARMIAAHHARSDWGAIIDLDQKDLESWVYLMHHIDDLSAKYGRISVSLLS